MNHFKLFSLGLLILIFALGCSEKGVNSPDFENSINDSFMRPSQNILQKSYDAQLKDKSRFDAEFNRTNQQGEIPSKGSAFFGFDTEFSLMKFEVNIHDISNITEINIHVAENPGMDGPVVATLFKAENERGLNGILVQGVLDNKNLTGPLNEQTLNELRYAMLKGLTYMNVQTVSSPDGVIRATIY
ncbi:MAG: CHRD domain-containing protein [Calditrichia bacterium]